MAKVKVRKKGGFLRALLAFLLGFIFAVAVEAGVVVAALMMPIDTLLNVTVGGNSDENGNKYIDTDSVNTLLDLIMRVQSIASQGGNMTVGELINLSPALDASLAELYSRAQSYGIYIDGEELKSQTASNLGSYLQDVMRDIRPYELISGSGMGGEGTTFDDNPLVKTLLLGAEAKTVSDGDKTYVVYYDEYVRTAEGELVRFDENGLTEDLYPDTLNADEWLTETNGLYNEELPIYKQYFYYDEEASAYTVTKAGEDGNFVYYENTSANAYPEQYGSTPLRETGNYITDENGERQYLTYTDSDGNEVSLAVTLGSLMNTSTAYRTLHYIGAAEALSGMIGGDSEILSALFEGVTMGDFMDGRASFDGRVEELELPILIDITADDEVKAYMGYRLTNMQPAAEDAEYDYTANYRYTDENGETVFGIAYVYVNAETGIIDRAVDSATGREIPATTVGELDEVVDNLEISTVLDITADDAVKAYVGYGITNLVDTGDGIHYTATYNYTDEEGNARTSPCTVTVNNAEEKIITSVVADDGQNVSSATINDLDGRVSGITSTLTISDLVPMGEDDRILSLVGHSTVDNLSATIDALAVQDVYADEIYNDYYYYVVAKSYEEGERYYTYDAVNGTYTVVSVTGNAEEGTFNPIYDESGIPIPRTYYTRVHADMFKAVGADEQPSAAQIAFDPSLTYYTYTEENGGTYTSVGTLTQEEFEQGVAAGTQYYAQKPEWFLAVAPDATDALPAGAQIQFDPSFLYYTYDAEADEYTLVGHTDSESGETVYDGRLTYRQFTAGVEAGNAYYTRGRAQGVWYLLLYTAEGDNPKAESIYTINDLGSMMTTATSGMTNSTLWDFYEAGIIDEPSARQVPYGDALDSSAPDFVYDSDTMWRAQAGVDGNNDPVYVYYNKKPIRDCTINELLSAVDILAGFIDDESGN